MEDETQDSDRGDEGVERDAAGRTPGRAEPLTGEQADDKSQNADIPRRYLARAARPAAGSGC